MGDGTGYDQAVATKRAASKKRAEPAVAKALAWDDPARSFGEAPTGARKMPWSDTWLLRAVGVPTAYQGSHEVHDRGGYYAMLELLRTSPHQSDQRDALLRLLRDVLSLTELMAKHDPMIDGYHRIITTFLRIQEGVQPRSLDAATMAAIRIELGSLSEDLWVKGDFDAKRLPASGVADRVRQADALLTEVASLGNRARRFRKGASAYDAPVEVAARASFGRGNSELTTRMLAAWDPDTARELQRLSLMSKLATCFTQRGTVQRGRLGDLIAILRSAGLGKRPDEELDPRTFKTRMSERLSLLRRERGG